MFPPCPPRVIGSMLALAAVASGAPQGDSAGSLEALLERTRIESARAEASLRSGVEAALAPLEQAQLPFSDELRDGVIAALSELGPEAGPLLLPALDPAPRAAAAEEPATEGDEATEPKSDPNAARARARAQVVAEGLAGINSMALTDGLLALLHGASTEGRINALRVLETCPEPARPRPAVTDVFESESGALRQAALRTLIRIRDPDDAELLRRVLASDDATIVGLALEAIVETGSSDAATEVYALLANSTRAARHAAGLLAFYAAQPDLVEESVLERFVAIARSSADVDVRISVLESLPALLSRGSSSALRRALEPVTRTSDRRVREAALVALVKLGDRGARRDLLRPFDDFVDKNDRFPEAYVRRGAVHLRVEDWDDAIRDFQQAVKLARDDPRPQPDAYVGLARAYARRGKLKDAAEWLRKAPISTADLRKLAEDPDFLELRASKYGKEAFGT